MIQDPHQALANAQRGWGHRSGPAHAEQLLDDLDYRLHLRHGQASARVLKSDMPFPANRTTNFPAGEGGITFHKDANTVSFDTGQYRNVVDRARSSPTGAALFNRLQSVKWTRETGGIFHGNNELNDEETDRGQHATIAYGPIGAAQEPSHCQEYTDSKGHRVTRAELSKLQSQLWDAQRQLQNRMAKAANAAGRGKTTAASNSGSFASYAHAEPTIRLNSRY